MMVKMFPMPKTCPKCRAVCYCELAKFCVCGHKFGEEIVNQFMDIFKDAVKGKYKEKTK